MKKVISLFVVSVGLFIVAGCQESAKKEKAVETTVKADSNFPPIMVGVWEADVNDNTGAKWGIKLEKDGSIRKIIHSVAGHMNLQEGGIYGEGPDKGTFIYFIPGHCFSDYNPRTKMLKVTIVIDEYMMKLPTGELKGRIEDYFEGPISKNGKTWNVEWRDYGWLEGARPPDVNAINANPEKLIFRRLDMKKEYEKQKQKQKETQKK